MKPKINIPPMWEGPPKVRTPKLGDIVGVVGQDARFAVSAIDTPRTTVEIHQIGKPESLLHGIPWDLLTYPE